MKRLVSSLILPAMAIGCATRGTYSTSAIEERFLLQESPRPWSPNLSTLQKTIKKDSKIPLEKQIFNFYCSQGRQVRSLKTRIQTVVSKPPAGTPIDEAAQIQNKKRQLIQEQIKNFYKILIFEDGLTRTGFGQEIELSEFFATEATSSQEFITRSKLPTESCESGCMSLVSYDQDSQLILSFGLHRYQIQYVRKKFLIPKYLLIGTDANRSGFVSANKQTISAFSSIASESSTEHRTMTDLYFIEKILAEKYTMLVPEGAQGSIFGGKTFFTSNGGQFSLSDAGNPENLKRLWATYLSRFTTFKESQSSDPQIIEYEVELDLRPLCSYGRTIDDLTSK